MDTGSTDGTLDRRKMLRRTALGAAALGGTALAPQIVTASFAPSFASASSTNPPCEQIGSITVTGPAQLTGLGFELPVDFNFVLESNHEDCATECKATISVNSPDAGVPLSLELEIDNVTYIVSPTYDPGLANTDVAGVTGGYVGTLENLPCTSGTALSLTELEVTSPIALPIQFTDFAITPC